MDGTAVEQIERIVVEGQEPQTEEIHGIPHSVQELKRVTPPVAKALTIQTLTGFRDLIEKEIGTEGNIAHIVSPDEVRLFAELDNTYRRREQFGVATCTGLFDVCPFGRYMALEPFLIGLQSRFVRTPELAEVVKLLGTIEEGAVRTHDDDGFTQNVTVKQGITRRAEASVPSPVTLRPYRTFPELEQPESAFILRLQPGGDEMPQVALFEADGGAWKLAAIQTIRAWLEKNVTGLVVIA